MPWGRARVPATLEQHAVREPLRLRQPRLRPRGVPALLAGAGVRRLHAGDEKGLKTVALDVPTWRTLMILKEQGAGSMSDIALHAVAKLSTVTKTVCCIKEEGLVETSTSTQDARVPVVSLTPAGQRHRARPARHAAQRAAQLRGHDARPGQAARRVAANDPGHPLAAPQRSQCRRAAPHRVRGQGLRPPTTACCTRVLGRLTDDH